MSNHKYLYQAVISQYRNWQNDCYMYVADLKWFTNFPNFGKFHQTSVLKIVPVNNFWFFFLVCINSQNNYQQTKSQRVFIRCCVIEEIQVWTSTLTETCRWGRQKFHCKITVILFSWACFINSLINI